MQRNNRQNLDRALLKSAAWLVLAIAAMPLASANAALVNRYMANGDGVDSVGGANGTLLDPGGTASFASGTVVSTTNANNTDYLSLPSTVGSGITGDFSIEDWLTQTGSETAFTSIFSLSSATPTNLGTTNFILLNPNRNGTGTTADFDQPGVTNGGAGTEVNINAPNTTFKVNGNFGTELQIVLTYVSSTGIASIYNDGTLLASGNVGTGFSLQEAANGGGTSYDGIGGGDAFGDPDFMGATNDFRIYSQALSPAQITALGSAGANATNAQINAIVPEPASLAVLVGLGALMGRRRPHRGA
jgi:Concanavalin A-like lectin/glucanases superfamily